MRVHVGSGNRVKRDAVQFALQRLDPDTDWDVGLVEADTDVPEQPLEAEVARGARERARAATATTDPPDYGVGVEAGLVWNEVLGVYFDVQYAVIRDQGGHETAGHGPGFVYPPDVIRAVIHEGRTVGDAMSSLTGIDDIGSRMGAIGYLSLGHVDRTALTEQAIVMAWLPRLRPDYDAA